MTQQQYDTAITQAKARYTATLDAAIARGVTGHQWQQMVSYAEADYRQAVHAAWELMQAPH